MELKDIAQSWAEEKRKKIEQVIASGKRFFYLQMPQDYLQRPTPRYILISGGLDSFFFYFKLMLFACPTAGLLKFSEKYPYTAKMLACLIYDDPQKEEFVKGCLDDWVESGLIERTDDGTLFLPEVAEMMVSRSIDAIRQENAKNRKEEENNKQVKESQKDESVFPW